MYVSKYSSRHLTTWWWHLCLFSVYQGLVSLLWSPVNGENVVFCFWVCWDDRRIGELTKLIHRLWFRFIFHLVIYASIDLFRKESLAFHCLCPAWENSLIGWSNYGLVCLTVFIIRLDREIFILLFFIFTYLFLYSHIFFISIILTWQRWQT